ncbi:hypothetical protein T4B_8736 [Trichinella pseudospiralis]|uniref:Uncharacterized protein n=1 Tax=Trichinella pseudospiralis TaxID=6337 RepID=A0A0V1IQE3_TRIPS|nr:hypothetical protein T4A_4154 [Trichinella pseudospiralis]KRZ25010.1 hypothetical protein T4B_8736 [Trichinella pseudospiralis]KRZ34408.1 hypothetical protein T4C_12905 [Trichinella pseudospiralis]
MEADQHARQSWSSGRMNPLTKAFSFSAQLEREETMMKLIVSLYDIKTETNFDSVTADAQTFCHLFNVSKQPFVKTIAVDCGAVRMRFS